LIFQPTGNQTLLNATQRYNANKNSAANNTLHTDAFDCTHVTHAAARTQQEPSFKLFSSTSNSPTYDPDLDPEIACLRKMQRDIFCRRQAIDRLLALLTLWLTNDTKDTAEPLPEPPINPMTPAITQPSPMAKVSTTLLLDSANTNCFLTVILSRIGRFLHDTQTQNLTLWIPDALYRCHNPNRTTGHSRIPVQHFPHDTSTFPSMEPILYCVNNPLEAEGATEQYTPAFDIHLSWQVNCQNYYQNPHRLLMDTTVQAFAPNMPRLSDHRQYCHQHHSLPANYATSPYNPAFDIHPTLTDHRQQSHQYHTCFPLATYVQVFAQNKWPP